MNEIPMWWLVLSGLFFALNVVLFAALAYLALEFAKFQKTLQPKITELTEKVNSISKNVEELSAHVKNTAGSANIIARSASQQFEKYSPIIMGVTTALRLFKAFQEFRGSGTKPAPDHQKSADGKGKKLAKR